VKEDAGEGFVDKGWSATAYASQDAVDFFQGLRGGDDDFYVNALEAMTSVYCLDLSNLKEQRYVERGDKLAALDKGGQCIESKDFDPQPADYCEVVETCYWAPIKVETEREKKIEDEELQRSRFEKYYTDLGTQYLGPPIAVAVINFVATFIFFIARCCCGKCTGKNGKKAAESEYTKAEKLVPLWFFTVFSLAVMVTAAVAYVGNDTITIGLFDTTAAATTGLDNMETFMLTSKSILEDMQGAVEGAVEEATVTIDGSDWLVEGAERVPDMLVAVSTKYASNKLLAGIKNLKPTLDEAVQVSRDSIAPVVGDFQDTLDTVRNELVAVKGGIIEQTGDAIDSVDVLLDSIVDFKGQIDHVETQLENTELFRKGGVVSLFALTIGLIVLAYIGVCAGLTPCKGDDCTIHLMNLTWMFGSLIATLAFVVGGAALTISVVWSDVCFFSDLVVENLGDYVDEQTATGLNACFDNTGLVQAYNLTDELDFSGKIETQLAVLEDLDVSTSFYPVHERILAVGKAIEEFDLTPLLIELNSLTADGVSTRDTNLICADYVVSQDDHRVEFTAENVREPWLVHASGKQIATWSGESFARTGGETGLHYIQRVYKSSCNGPPVPFDEAIEEVWAVAVGTVQIKEDMLRDLGTDTVLCAALGCPTNDFDFSDSVNGFFVEYESKLVCQPPRPHHPSPTNP
jgi:hypothetical protein